MASDHIPVVGEMADMYGDKIMLKLDGDVVIVAFDDGLGTYFAMCLDADRRDQFIKLYAEAERRAEAMPGQAAASGQGDGR